METKDVSISRRSKVAPIFGSYCSLCALGLSIISWHPRFWKEWFCWLVEKIDSWGWTSTSPSPSRINPRTCFRAIKLMVSRNKNASDHRSLGGLTPIFSVQRPFLWHNSHFVWLIELRARVSDKLWQTHRSALLAALVWHDFPRPRRECRGCDSEVENWYVWYYLVLGSWEFVVCQWEQLEFCWM